MGLAIIRDPAFICTFDKNHLAFNKDWRLLETLPLLEVLC